MLYVLLQEGIHLMKIKVLKKSALVYFQNSLLMLILATFVELVSSD